MNGIDFELLEVDGDDKGGDWNRLVYNNTRTRGHNASSRHHRRHYWQIIHTANQQS